MADGNPYEALAAKERTNGAGAAYNGAVDMSPADARTAIKAAPVTGIAPSLGAYDALAQKEALQSHQDAPYLADPVFQKSLAQSPAHVAATREDWPTFAKVAEMAKNFAFGVRSTAGATGEGLLAPGMSGVSLPGPQLPDPMRILGHLIQKAQDEAAGFIGVPTDPANRAAFMAGQFSVGALFKGSALNRALQVALPLAGEEAGFYGGKAVGGETGGQIGSAVGAILGGIPPALRFYRPPQTVRNVGPFRAGETDAAPLPGPLKPPGVNPEHTPHYVAAAEQDVADVKAMQDTVAETATHKDLPAVSAEFLSHTDIAGHDAWVDTDTLLQLYSEGHTPFAGMAVDIAKAAASGAPLRVPLSVYQAETAGQPYADALNATTRFREDGVSVEEGKGLKEETAPATTRVTIFHGGSDFEALDAAKLGSGEPGGIRPFGKDALYGGVAVHPEDMEAALELARRYTKYARGAPMLHAFEADLDPKILNLAYENLHGIYGVEGLWKAEALPFQAREDLPTSKEIGVKDLSLLRRVGKWAGDTPAAQIMEELAARGKPQVQHPTDVVASVPRELPAAVDSAVEEVFAEQNLTQLFTDKKALGLTQTQFDRYDAMLSEAKAALTDKILQRTYDQIRRERTPEWKDQVARQAAEVEAAVFADPVHAARMALQYNQGPRGEPLETPPVKLDKSVVVSVFGQSTADALPRTMFGADGLHPDDAAELLGYDSGQELLSDMLTVQEGISEGEGYKAALKRRITEAAAENARSALGYDVSPEGLLAAAREAATLPQVEDFLTAQLDAFNLPYDKAALQVRARELMNPMRVADARNAKQFADNMRRLGNKTEAAISDGDVAKAFDLKQKQVIQWYQFKDAMVLNRNVAITERKFAYWAKKVSIKGMSQPFLNQLHTYLPQYGFPNRREPQELAEALRGVDLPTFVSEVISTNATFPSVPKVDPSRIKDLTVEDFWKVRGFAFAMNRYGRELQTALNEGKREDRELVVQTALASVPPGKPPAGTPPGELPPINADSVKSWDQGFVSFLKSVDAFHRKTADMVEWLDRGNPMGVWAQNTYMRMNEGADVDTRLHREAYKPLTDAWKAVPDAVKRGYNTKLDSPFTANGRRIQMYRRNVVRLASYLGSPVRAQKAAEGFGVPLETLHDWVNAYITPEEVAVVQAMWGGFEHLQTPVSAALRSQKGEGLRREETAPVMLGGIQTNGGYVPLEYNNDPEVNPRVTAWEAERAAQLSPDPLDHLFNQVMPNSGFAEEVTSYVGPVNVELEGLSRLFNAQIKYAAYARPVSDVRRFIYEPRIAATIKSTMGEEYTKVIPDWLDSIVQPFGDASMQGRADRWFEFVGRNMTAGALAWNYGTLVAQSAGFVNGVAVLSGGNVGRGMAAMMHGYGETLKVLGDKEARDALFAGNEFLRSRYGAVEQNMTDMLLEADDFRARGMVREGVRKIEHAGFHMIGMAEAWTVAIPTYFGALKQAEGMGMSAGDAQRYANRMVVKSQGSGRRVDLAAVQRMRGAAKLMYAFQSYFNQQYQLTVDIYRNIAGRNLDAGLPPPPPPLIAPDILDAEQGPDGTWSVPPKTQYNIAQAAILGVLVIIAQGAVANALQHKKQSIFDPLFNALHPILGANDIASALQRHLGYENGHFVLKNPQDDSFGQSLYVRAGEVVVGNALNLGKYLTKKKHGGHMKLSRPVQTGAGLLQLAGFPLASPIGKAGEYVYERNTGEQKPREGFQGWIDTYNGLTGGPQPEQKPAGRGRVTH